MTSFRNIRKISKRKQLNRHFYPKHRSYNTKFVFNVIHVIHVTQCTMYIVQCNIHECFIWITARLCQNSIAWCSWKLIKRHFLWHFNWMSQRCAFTFQSNVKLESNWKKTAVVISATGVNILKALVVENFHYLTLRCYN